MAWLFASFDTSVFKPACKMAVKRMELKKNSETAKMRTLKKEIVGVLEAAAERPGMVELALIKVEGIIRKDHELQALELLQLMCELLYERAGLIKACKRTDAPEDLLGAMHTTIWCAPRLGIAELRTMKEQLGLKFGADFVAVAASDKSSASRVEPKVRHRLTMPTPPLEQKAVYLRSIVEEAKKDIDVAELLRTAECVLGSSGWPMPPAGEPRGPGGAMPPAYSPASGTPPMSLTAEQLEARFAKLSHDSGMSGPGARRM
ncbi:hypothetical protein FNF29_04841 [Cafeteria roenbergensis]|uniref:IST1 homolog n=1 Tax=Cafeteria roenbergensis TaxID=33653 RepID=A0A5A8CGK3_CAFRO|nr:hypothetical protein FNF29_04841 [Cafeteria roenbergensis]|eukprot:KAA0150951.1 hypothetical protein FNF29_04841 [Cafeteria roenbergensis]